MTPETLYRQLAALIAEMPDLETDEDYGEVEHRWLGKACALVEASGQLFDAATLSNEATRIARLPSRTSGASTIRAILYRALARAELAAPPQAQGSFVSAGQTFSAFQALSRVMGTTERDLLIVDPYLSAQALSEYGTSVSEGVSLRLLLDPRRAQLNDGTRLAAQRWAVQFGAVRPLEARVLPTSQRLHDRLLIIDQNAVWLPSQSLKDFAAHSHASVQKADAETAAAKVEAYEEMWAASTVL